MSKRVKQPYGDMKYCADLLVAKLQPACERIAIAGSLRRKVAYCADIELVAVPKLGTNLLGEPVAEMPTRLDALLDSLPIHVLKRGPKYVQFWFDGSRAPFFVDLFIQPDAATWGVNYLLRTGPSAFSRRMVTAQAEGGYRPNQYIVQDARVWQNGIAMHTAEESDVFALWGMAFVMPEERH